MAEAKKVGNLYEDDELLDCPGCGQLEFSAHYRGSCGEDDYYLCEGCGKEAYSSRDPEDAGRNIEFYED